MKHWKACALALGFILLIAAAKTIPNQLWFQSTSAGGVLRKIHEKEGDLFSVKDFGAVGDSTGTGVGTDNLTYFQAAYAALPSTGGTIIIPNDGNYYRINCTGATVASPIIAMNITKPNVHIVGIGRPTILIDGFTTTTSDAGGADVVGADICSIFSFNSTSHGSVDGIRFIGIGDGTTPITVGKARAKAVGFTDSTHMRAANLWGYRVAGNIVNARGTNTCTTAYVETVNSFGDGSNENNFNYMGGTCDSTFNGNVSINSPYQGFESGTFRLVVTGNVLKGNKNGWSHVGHDATFSGNTVRDNTVTGVNLQYNDATFDCSDTTITGNTIKFNLAVGILVNSNCHDGTITGNRVYNNGPTGATTGEGIKISASATDFLIAGNDLGDNQGGSATQKWGVDVLGSRVSVLANRCHGNTSLCGLSQGTPDTVRFSGNDTDGAFSCGGSTTNCTVRGNDGKLGPVLDTYGATVTLNAGSGERHQLTVTDTVAYTLAAPTNAESGKLMCVRLKNASGGVMGAITVNAAFKMPSIVAPANGQSRYYCWIYDGTNWVELSRSTADVPN